MVTLGTGAELRLDAIGSLSLLSAHNYAVIGDFRHGMSSVSLSDLHTQISRSLETSALSLSWIPGKICLLLRPLLIPPCKKSRYYPLHYLYLLHFALWDIFLYFVNNCCVVFYFVCVLYIVYL